MWLSTTYGRLPEELVAGQTEGEPAMFKLYEALVAPNLVSPHLESSHRMSAL